MRSCTTISLIKRLRVAASSSVLLEMCIRDRKRPVPKIDFSPYGAAIKAARTGQKESRNKVGDEIDVYKRQVQL